MGGQLSFTMSRLNLFLKILGEILICRLTLKISGDIQVSNPWGESIISHHVQANFKNLRWHSGQQSLGGSIMLDHIMLCFTADAQKLQIVYKIFNFKAPRIFVGWILEAWT